MLAIQFYFIEGNLGEVEGAISFSSLGDSTLSILSSSMTGTNTIVLVGPDVFDGFIAFSNDFGVTWSITHFSETPISDVVTSFRGEEMISLVVGYDGTILRSFDGGMNFTQIETPIFDHLNGVDIGLNGNAFITGELGVIYMSDNSSNYESWFDITPSFTSSISEFNDISTYTGEELIAVGPSGNIYVGNRTTSGDWHWMRVNGVTTNEIFSVSQASPTVAMIVGRANFAAKTVDGKLF